MLVGVAGGPDAGKRDVCHLLMNRLSDTYAAKVAMVSLTDFYLELSTEERALYEQGKLNLDHPNRYDFQLLEDVLRSLLAGKPTSIPTIDPVDVIIVEGTLVLYPKSLRELMFMKVFVDVDSDQRLTRRVRKSKSRNGKVMSIKELLAEYVEFVKPTFDDFIMPSKKFADIIVPRGVENTAALSVMASHLEDHLRTRSSAVTRTGEEDDTDSVASAVSRNAFRSTDLLATTAVSAYKEIPE
ncbi:Uridine-cytidine kinase-like 1 [Apophysomyces ossiformis]|uniref:Uridine-cytidine kinase-like 1 n=1 Tax=Apophysomyces ossiformis TaxID=679940 RepID=A0A8H7BVR7_9FUNG|nr:Uridine-cytidine kinase-like 1 [Apophysomyces ossiformis]